MTEYDDAVEPEDTASGPTCNRCGRPTDYQRGRYGLCRICDDADFQARQRSLDRSVASHPAKGKRRPFRLLRSYEYLGHQEEGIES